MKLLRILRAAWDLLGACEDYARFVRHYSECEDCNEAAGEYCRNGAALQVIALASNEEALDKALGRKRPVFDDDMERDPWNYDSPKGGSK